MSPINKPSPAYLPLQLRFATYFQYLLVLFGWGGAFLATILGNSDLLVFLGVCATIWLAFFQLGYGFFVGLRFKSNWHLRWAKRALNYLILISALLMLLIALGAFFIFFICLIVFSVAVPAIFVTWYAWHQVRHIPAQQPTSAYSDATLLDDDF